MKDVFGIIFSNMHDHEIRELTAQRCMGSLPVGGRYRLIDFILSGFSNAGITNTAVIAKSNYKSLLDHIGNGREWDLARKRGGLMVLPPAAITDSGFAYKGRVEALAGIMSIIHGSTDKYILCADCDQMANIDYGDFSRFHQQSGADITVMYRKVYRDATPNRSFSTFQVEEDGTVSEMFIAPAAKGEQNEYMNIMLISRELLEWLVKDCLSRNLDNFDRDVLQANVKEFKVNAYEFKEPAFRFDSIKAYYDSNLALLDPKVRTALFRADRPIYTRVFDEAPVKYGLDARVENSLLADGCIIDGEVENSLLFRGVHVGKGAKVKNCVLMQGTYVGNYCELENVITDRIVSVKDNRTIIGAGTYPMYIKKASIV
jgi:glucose-1-phosphate adenylyltransferase